MDRSDSMAEIEANSRIKAQKPGLETATHKELLSWKQAHELYWARNT